VVVYRSRFVKRTATRTAKKDESALIIGSDLRDVPVPPVLIVRAVAAAELDLWLMLSAAPAPPPLSMAVLKLRHLRHYRSLSHLHPEGSRTIEPCN
jgi:hypothetical protein